MMTTTDFISWLKSLAPSLTFLDRPASPLPDKPDRLVMVTRLPGVGETMDGLFDRPLFSVRVRGPAMAPGTVEADAILLDAAIRSAALPAVIGDSWVTSIIRFGGLGPMPGTPDTGQRSEWVASYIATASTNL